MTDFDTWLKGHEKTGEFINLSKARAFAHPEDKYDDQYKISPESFVHGAGLIQALRASKADFSGPALELACGTGLLTVGLVRDSPYPSVIVTDPSVSFLELTKRKLSTLKSPSTVHLAVLLAEDMEQFPPGSLSLIVLRSALHHFIDVNAFLAAASRALKPGGVLAFEEPCEEGYLLMGLIGHFLTRPEVHQGKFSQEQLAQLKLFADTMKFYVRRDMDKSQAEDKHVFRLDELITRGAQVGLSCEYHPNRSFGAYVDPNFVDPLFDFQHFFLTYLRYCMAFSQELVDAVAPLVKPTFDYLAEASANNPRHVTVLGFFKKL